MKTKTFFAIIISATIILFSSTCFATNMINDAGNGVRNVVNGAGNVIEGATKGAGNVLQSFAGGIGEGMSDIGNGIQNMTRDNNENNNNTDNNTANNTNNNASGYTATRTATTAGGYNDTFLGMTATTWSWLIIAILGVSIVTLVWFYGKQHEDGYKPEHEDNY